jgi:hypothetical protein
MGLAPDGLGLDGHHVSGEGDEVVAGSSDGHVTRRRIHHLVGVDVAGGAEVQQEPGLAFT